MDFQIKSEQNSVSSCIACLRNDIQLFGEQEMPPEIVSAYKDIVKDEINNLGSAIEICFECMEMLNNINEFKSKCVKSLQALLFKASTILEDEKSQELSVNNFCTTLIKDEDDIFTDEIKFEQVKVERKKPGPKPKKSKIVLKNLKSPRYKQQNSNIPITSIKAYCHICCYEHNNSHKHAIEMHSKLSEDNSLKCLICEDVDAFKDVDALLLHLESKHKKFDHPRKCGKCEMVTKSREEYVKHLHMSHYNSRKRVYPCPFCHAVFFDREAKLKYHIPRHFGALKCKNCEMTFLEKEKYEEHVDKHNKKFEAANYICDFCGIVIKKKYLLTKHMLTNHVNTTQNVKCHLCEKVCKTIYQLRNHVHSVHTEKTIPCFECGKKFKMNSILKKHVRQVHTNDPAMKRPKQKRPETRNFACDQCDLKFFTISMLKKHMHVHSKTRPYNCTMCKTGYYCNEYLRKHFLREHGLIYTTKEVRKLCGLKKQGDDSD